MNADTNYINQRMEAMGINDFHIQLLSLKIEPGAEKSKINACNEYLFLISEQLPQDLIIHSDKELFCSSMHHNLSQYPREFSGMTYIESPTGDDYTIDFIRAIPR
jgi:hypothetical protein